MQFSRREILRSGIGGTSLVAIGLSGPATAKPEKQKIAERAISGTLRDGFDADDGVPQELTLAFATKLCDECGEFTVVEISSYEEQVPSSGDFRRAIEVAELLNTHLDAGIATQELKTLYESSQEAERYIPLIVSSKRIVEAACDLQESKAEVDMKRFYIAVLVFIAECALFSSVGPYRVSFSATRYIANNLLVNFRKALGFRLYATLLKEVHWAVRGTLTGVPGYIWEKSDTLASEYDDFHRPGIRDVLETDLISIGDWIKLEFGISI